MKDDHIATNGIMRNLTADYMALTRNMAELEGNFGYWCLYDENIFCQEREGCNNCMIKKKPRI
jgi:hypothetical protein